MKTFLYSIILISLLVFMVSCADNNTPHKYKEGDRVVVLYTDGVHGTVQGYNNFVESYQVRIIDKFGHVRYEFYNESDLAPEEPVSPEKQ